MTLPLSRSVSLKQQSTETKPSDRMKRKASELEDLSSNSWSPSSNSSHASEYFQDQPTFVPASWSFRPNQRLTGNDYMNLRTRKRVRDNRPDERTIHQQTLAKLFRGQRHLEHAEVPTRASCLQAIDNQATQRPQKPQQSLHLFFDIQQKQPAFREIANQSLDESARMCEDCGTKLDQYSGMHTDMEMMDVDPWNTSLEGEYDCADCGRRVCDTCAVRGDRRICLECAIPG